ncbi:ribonuclease H-like domain-containing protein [Mycena floridula]|nr:ribonuclease H-like domain-containing protein [Mycena floridula]
MGIRTTLSGDLGDPRKFQLLPSNSSVVKVRPGQSKVRPGYVTAYVRYLESPSFNPKQRKMPPRSPFWRLFHSNGDNYLTDKTHKAAWCQACLDHTISTEKERQRMEITNSADPGAFPQKTEVEWTAFALTRIAPVCGKPDSMKAHAKKCALVDRQTFGQVDKEAADAKGSKGAGSSRSNSLNITHSNSPSLSPPLSRRASVQLSPLMSSSLPYFGSPSETLPSSSMLFSGGLDPSPSQEPPQKRAKYAHLPAEWSPEQQQDFGADFLKLIASTGVSFNFIANPETRLFTEKWIPGSKLPDRRVLSSSILDQEAEKVVAQTRDKVTGKLAMYQSDGWKTNAKRNVNTSMITVERVPYLLRTHDMSGRPKTGDELLSIAQDDIKYAEETYGVEVIGIATDNGPDAKKMRRRTKEEEEKLANFECWAHQMSLMTGNYLEIKTPYAYAMQMALDIVKWFNNHSKALDLLRKQLAFNIGKELQLFLPAATRWTAHYCSLYRTHQISPSIISCVVSHEQALLVAGGTKDDQMEISQTVLDNCQDKDFWNDLKKVTQHLQPLAIGANICQAPHCRLDHVLLTLANLFWFYNNLPASDVVVRVAMKKSLERRFGGTNQELMILAVFFNPYIRHTIFNRDSLPSLSIFHMLRRAYRSFFKESIDSDIEFMNAFDDYMAETNIFSQEAMWLDGFKKMYEQSDKDIDLPRNRMKPEKVHKVTTVRMDRRGVHKALGMVYQRKKRHFGDQSLNDKSAAAVIDDEPHDDSPTTLADVAAALVADKKIKLADLFIYPDAGTESSALQFYWMIELMNLEEEIEELAQENNVSEDS